MATIADIVRFNRIIFRDQVFPKEYLNRTVDECARYCDNNIRSNSPIVYLVAPNHIKTIIGFLGIVKTGRAALLVDPKVGKLEYDEMLADTAPSAILRIDPQTVEFDYSKEVELTDYSMDRSLVSQLDDVCVMLYTAADDGYAKAAMLTHRNMLSNARAIAGENQVNQKSIVCALLPFHHLYGFQNGIILPLISGSSLMIGEISNMLKTNILAEEIYRHKISHVYSVPLIFYLLSKSPCIGEIGRQAHILMSGGYKLPASLRSRFEQKLGIPIYEGYGLTEASPVCTCQNPDKQREKASIGPPMADYRIKIVDEEGKEVPLGQKGEIWFKGDNIMKGYFNFPEATKQKIVDGWLRTGDYGKQDENGDVFFLGLKKKMFNVAGNKVYPEEIKRLLMKNNDVERVDFFSDYNEIFGDRLRGNVTLRDTSQAAAESFMKWYRENLTSYKISEKITFTENKLLEKRIIDTGTEVFCGCS